MRTTIDLPVSANGAKLRSMVGAVIYIRVSTKEQTENLNLKTHEVPRHFATVGDGAY